MTNAPGLVGALLVGVSFAKALAFARGIPVVGVHHMEGHLFATALEHRDAVPPFTALLVSGGHTLLLDVEAWGRYRLLGRTRDDAAGEAFDKVAKLLGLPYPGGPHVERLARDRRVRRASASRGRCCAATSSPATTTTTTSRSAGSRPRCCNAVRAGTPDDHRATSRARFQDALVETLVEKTARAVAAVRADARRARRRRGVQPHARRGDARAHGAAGRRGVRAERRASRRTTRR